MKRVPLKQKVLDENDRIAQKLRALFARQRILALNFVSSPGSGKTSLLEQTLMRMPDDLSAVVLTGDIATDKDAERLLRYGTAKQITTGGSCHLDARMVDKGLEELSIENMDFLFIENVGNLVCPAGFDLGEDAKIVLLSVTEGDDKPLKYPNIIVRSDLVILNKMDLLPYVPFDEQAVLTNARRVNPRIEILKTSCTSGEGIDDWFRWLRRRLETFRSRVQELN